MNIYVAKYYKDPPRYLAEGPLHPLTSNLEEAIKYPDRLSCSRAIGTLPAVLSVSLDPHELKGPTP